jgi:S1-C subfamily serine protease
LILGLALAAIPLQSLLGRDDSQAPVRLQPDATRESVAPEERAPSIPAPVGAAAVAVSADSDAASGARGTTDNASSPAFEDIVARTIPAVVSIHAGQSRGTGFFVRPDYVLTNAHVIEGHTSVELQSGPMKYAAQVTSVSPGTDLALLHVFNAAGNQPTLALGSLTDVRVGQEVIAVGSALGVLP